MRNYLHQNNLDPDTTKLDFLPNYRASASITTSAIEWDKADTLRVNGKLSKGERKKKSLNLNPGCHV